MHIATGARYFSFRGGLAASITLALVAALTLQTALLEATTGPRPLPQDAGLERSGKKVLDSNDYERWRRLTGAAISDDGKWVTYGYRKLNTLDPGVTLHLKALGEDTEFEVQRGSSAQFSDDSRWAAYFVDPAHEQPSQPRRRQATRPRQVQLLNLASGERVTWSNARDFQFAVGSGFLAVKKVPTDRDADHQGADLVLRDLDLGTEQLIGSVNEFAFNRQRAGDAEGPRSEAAAQWLAYTVDAADQAGNGLYAIALDSRVLTPLDNDARTYARLTWNIDGSALAVLKGNKPDGHAQRHNILLAVRQLEASTDHGGSPIVSELDPTFIDSFPDGMVISERAAIAWSADLGRVFFGLDEQEDVVEEPEHPDRVANVDVWHVQDERIQSVQMMQAQRDRDFTYRAAVALDGERVIALTDETMRRITISRDGRWGVGVDDRAYVSDWKERQADYYRVDTGTGDRTLMLRGHKLTLGLSPDGRYFLYWNDAHLWLYELDSGRTRNLTVSAPVSFVNQEHDYPDTPPPYGVAGWTEDGSSVLLNHRYDLWQQPLDGAPAVNLTGGQGDAREIRFRHVRTDDSALTVDLRKPLLLSAYGQWSKQAGFFRLSDGELRELVFDDRRFGRPLKARSTDIYLVSRETFQEFPDLYASDGSFADLERITDANPWQSEYRWGRRLLFDYTNADGVRLQGTLAIPDDYVAGERRPMLVNFYEKNSQNLHRHVPPRYVTGFGAPLIEAVSKGYLVMQPDIHFRTGNTHADMLECVEAATREVIEMGYADPDRIGLLGHSFSGQGSAYIAGTSKLFAAIAAGAAATDLLADFNHMWGWTPTNMNGTGENAHRYDYYQQGRLGTNPYDDRELYWRESPTNHVRAMDMPLLLMHGTADGVVGIMEAIQLYNGLRFNNKNVILLSYPDEGHSLANLANRRDLAVRMLEFFDHHLTGSPAPAWMVEGVPFLEKQHGAWDRGSVP